MSQAKTKGTLEIYLESLSPKERRKREEGYKELLISEMIIAALQNDAAAVKELAKMAGISSTEAQDFYAGLFACRIKDLLKLFQSFGYSILAEKGDEKIDLTELHSTKMTDYIVMSPDERQGEGTTSMSLPLPRIARGK